MRKRRLVFFDRSGREITDMEWYRLLSNQDYVFIRETRGAQNRKEHWEVLTLWTGYDIQGVTPPRIFETLVCTHGGITDILRCDSLATALYFHNLFAREKWREEDDVV